MFNQKKKKTIAETIEAGKNLGATDDEIIEELKKINPKLKTLLEEAQDLEIPPQDILEETLKYYQEGKDGPLPMRSAPVSETKKEIVQEPESESKSDPKQSEDLFELKTPEAQNSGKKIDQVFKTQKKEKGKDKLPTGKVDTRDDRRIRLAKMKGRKLWGLLLSIVGYPLIGIDISDHSIEVLYLNNQRRLRSYGRTILPAGVVINGEIIKQKELIEALRETFKQAKPEALVLEGRGNIKAILSLPESKTYIHYFTFESPRKLNDQVKAKIQRTIPLPFDNLYWDFLRVDLPSGKVATVVTVASKEVVDNYIHFLRSTGIMPITPLVFEPESMSIARALLPKTFEVNKKKKDKQKKKVKTLDTLILDIGARTSTLGVHNRAGLMVFSASLPYGGNYFTKQISEKLNIPYSEAEELKIKQGLSSEDQTLIEPVKKIAHEINQARDYFKKEFKRDIEQIILAGGSASLPGLIEFLKKELNLPVVLGNPLAKIKTGRYLSSDQGVLYSNVIGLALRGIAKDPVTEGINLLPSGAKARERKRHQKEHKSFLIASFVFALMNVAILMGTIYYFAFFPKHDEFKPLPPRMDLEKQLAEILGRKEKVEVELLARINLVDEMAEFNFFSEPSIEAETISLDFDQETLWPVLERNAEWVKIEIGGEGVWLLMENVELIEAEMEIPEVIEEVEESDIPEIEIEEEIDFPELEPDLENQEIIE